ncbi:hypothetical protein [Streptomyces orinoci]|uniref:Aldo/keto reductase n=1 Tax=Streptomyces orinoci TaxID=67339 RepID=A0ABV3K6B4_STRON|nr:hypothetical protein [Streptomyces orinoci]
MTAALSGTAGTAGTSKVAHLEENLAAARLHLTGTELGELTEAA